MMIAFRRHLDDASLAEVADLGTHDHLTPAERLHLDSCDRCRKLVTGHQRASRLLSASWRLVPAAELAGAGVTVVRPRVRIGTSLRSADARARTSWLRLAVVVGAALLLVVTALLTGSSRPPLPTSTRITFQVDGRLISVNTDGSSVESIVAGDGWNGMEWPAWSPDGSQLAFVRNGWGRPSQLVIVAADSPDQPRVLNEQWSIGGFEWSPDGMSLAGWDERGLVVIDAESGEGRLTVPMPGLQGGPLTESWSPDRSRILYTTGLSVVSGRPGGDLVVLDVGTAQEAFRYHADRWREVRVSRGAWSPDGSQFVYYAGPREPNGSELDLVDPRILVMDLDGSQPRELAAGKDPTWSPDGSLIAFEAPYEGATGWRPGIWVIGPDGSGLRFVGGEGVRPRWSPDGRQIAYCGHEEDDPDSRMGYFVADVAGGVPRPVYRTGCWYSGALDWQPTRPRG
ncbi:MAG: hypothetical protein AB1736_05495 [Chloroflexota bacterium]